MPTNEELRALAAMVRRQWGPLNRKNADSVADALEYADTALAAKDRRIEALREAIIRDHDRPRLLELALIADARAAKEGE